MQTWWCKLGDKVTKGHYIAGKVTVPGPKTYAGSLSGVTISRLPAVERLPPGALIQAPSGELQAPIAALSGPIINSVISRSIRCLSAIRLVRSRLRTSRPVRLNHSFWMLRRSCHASMRALCRHNDSCRSCFSRGGVIHSVKDPGARRRVPYIRRRLGFQSDIIFQKRCAGSFQARNVLWKIGS